MAMKRPHTAVILMTAFVVIMMFLFVTLFVASVLYEQGYITDVEVEGLRLVFELVSLLSFIFMAEAFRLIGDLAFDREWGGDVIAAAVVIPPIGIATLHAAFLNPIGGWQIILAIGLVIIISYLLEVFAHTELSDRINGRIEQEVTQRWS